MNNKEDSWKEIISEWVSEGAFWLAIVLAFFKTAELMSNYAPVILGFDTGYMYGVLAALLVEGVFVSMKYKLQGGGGSKRAQAVAGLMAVATWATSAAAQGLDSLIQSGDMRNLPQELDWALAYLVPAIPVLVYGGLTLASAIWKNDDTGRKTSVPGFNFGQGKPKQQVRQFTSSQKQAKPVIQPDEEDEDETFPTPPRQPGS